MRGGQFSAALTLSAALGTLSRFDTPPHRLSSLGLIPSAPPPGAHRRQGARTTPGPSHARRGLREGAGAARSPAKVSRHRPRRWEQGPQVSQDLRWTAPGRRGKRSRRVVARGKQVNPVLGARARAMAAVVWASARAVAHEGQLLRAV